MTGVDWKVDSGCITDSWLPLQGIKVFWFGLFAFTEN
jgi:hypothetical protein